ncbi:MAG: hypothetical protein AAGE37_01385 [Pseudomonadota bacterium]
MYRYWARIGALLFFLWGLLHLGAALSVFSLGSEQSGIVQGRLYQDASFLFFFAILAMITAYWNAKASKSALWINAIGTSAGDLPFLFFLVLPGLVPPPANFLGPLLWVSAIALSVTAYLLKPKSAALET